MEGTESALSPQNFMQWGKRISVTKGREGEKTMEKEAKEGKEGGEDGKEE